MQQPVINSSKTDVQYVLKILENVSVVLLVEGTGQNLSSNIPSKLLEQNIIDLEDLTLKLGAVKAKSGFGTLDRQSALGCLDIYVGRTKNLILGLLDVLEIHFKLLEDLNFNQIFVLTYKWYILSLEDRLEDYYKYQSCYLLSKILRQDSLINELPARPLWLTDVDGYIIGGKFFRYCRLCMVKDVDEVIVGQFYALTNVKRAGSAISEEKIQAALKKHQSAMCGAEYKPAPVTVQKFYNNKGNRSFIMKEIQPSKVLDLVVERMRQLIRIIYKNKSCKAVTYKVPSLSASYEASKQHGGMMGSLSTILKMDYTYLSLNQGEFIGFPNPRTSKKWFDPSSFPLYADVIPNDVINDLLFKQSLRNYYDNPIKCKVHKVLEPFKCRVITAGESIPYFLGRCLQTKLHHNLRDWCLYGQQPFRLIGAPVSVDLISDTYKSRELDKHEFYVAGDYSAATDGMHPLISSEFVKEYSLVVGLGDQWEKVFDACMRGHELYYEDGTVLKQTHGQLMGSPVSFPILCLANAAVNIVSFDLYYGTNISLEEWLVEHRPLFNGDDTSFISNAEHYGIWKRVASSCGLNSSLGKSYCHPKMVMINSEIFWRNTVDGDFNKVFCLNPGLVKGQAKVMSDTRKSCVEVDGVWVKDFSYTALSSCVDQLDKLLVGADEQQCVDTKNCFISHMLPRLKASDRPWSLPRHYGGLGLGIGSITPVNTLMCKLAKQSDSLWSSLRRTSRMKPAYLQRCENFISNLKEKSRSFVEIFAAKTRLKTDIELYDINVDDRPTLEKYFWGYETECSIEENYTRLCSKNKSSMNSLKPWSENKIEIECQKIFQKEIFLGLPFAP